MRTALGAGRGRIRRQLLTESLVYGVVAAFVCYFAIGIVKRMWKIDDSLDVFAVHGVGGMLGILLTSFFADPSLGGLGLAEGSSMGKAFAVQAVATVITVVWAGIASYVIVKVVTATVGLRVTPEDEVEGLDVTTHGERSYDL